MASKRLHGEDGASLVEFCFVLPILITLLFGIIEFGFVFNSYIELRSGSREGARLAVVNNGCVSSSSGCVGDGATQRGALIERTRTRLTGLADPDDVTIWVDYTSATVGSDATVCLSYPITSKTGFFTGLLNGKTLKSKAIMRMEQLATYSKSEGTSPC